MIIFWTSRSFRRQKTLLKIPNFQINRKWFRFSQCYSQNLKTMWKWLRSSSTDSSQFSMRPRKKVLRWVKENILETKWSRNWQHKWTNVLNNSNKLIRKYSSMTIMKKNLCPLFHLWTLINLSSLKLYLTLSSI